MTDVNQPIIFRQLLVKYPRIEVPLIQRDYAQGRETEKEVRDDFLKALHWALGLPSGHPRLPLNLDFIYGSMEGGNSGSFLPLDGQQRLTTLFLLHWYTAWRDGQSSEFESMLWDGKHSRFTYGVRPSSTEFFDELVRYSPRPNIFPTSFEHTRVCIQSPIVVVASGQISGCDLHGSVPQNSHIASGTEGLKWARESKALAI